MWGTGVFAADSKRAGPLPVRVADQSKPVAPDADKATVKTLLNQLFEAQQSGKTQTVQDTRDKLNALREKLGDEKFKAILEQLKSDVSEAWWAWLKALFPELFADEDGPSPAPSPTPPGGGGGVNRADFGPRDSMSDLPITSGASHFDYRVDNSNPGVAPKNIWSGFSQGFTGNCVTVSAIKAAMQQFGQKPTDVFKNVAEAGNGWDVVMRDGVQVHVSKDELKQAARFANFRGDDASMMTDANFMYAASAKRAQKEGNDGKTNLSFYEAMRTLNDGEVAREGLDRLGLRGLYRQGTHADFANGKIGTVEYKSHSMAVIGNRVELWGKRGGVPEPGIVSVFI